ncbi:hypothetical protein BDZ97DRAFT_1850651 [Flammula alnicola]|nr:hypothetical protein BDZ97DRAFT_1850651 [Flammula alnicola]
MTSIFRTHSSHAFFFFPCTPNGPLLGHFYGVSLEPSSRVSCLFHGMIPLLAPLHPWSLLPTIEFILLCSLTVKTWKMRGQSNTVQPFPAISPTTQACVLLQYKFSGSCPEPLGDGSVHQSKLYTISAIYFLAFEITSRNCLATVRREPP